MQWTISEENCELNKLFNFSHCLSWWIFFSSVKPSLKKVSKYENKFAKLQKKAAEFNFRQNLKVVKKKEFSMSEEDNEVKGLFWSYITYKSGFKINYIGKYKMFSEKETWLDCRQIQIIFIRSPTWFANPVKKSKKKQ